MAIASMASPLGFETRAVNRTKLRRPDRGTRFLCSHPRLSWRRVSLLYLFGVASNDVPR